MNLFISLKQNEKRHKKIAGAGFEPTTFGLWARRASRLLHPASIFTFLLYTISIKISILILNGWRWIRTTEAICSRFTVCPLWPLGNPSIWNWLSPKPMIGLEPITCWLQISCSANWATSAYKKWDLQGSNLWPSACKADALPAELRSHYHEYSFMNDPEGTRTLDLRRDRAAL